MDTPRTPHSISDGVLTLSPLTRLDATEHLAGEDRELQQWLNGGVSTPETVASYLDVVERRWREGAPIYHFAIRVGPRLHLAGTVDAYLEGSEWADANVAYGVYPAWRGRGIASRAVLLSLSYLGAHTTARRAFIRVHPGNAASAAVARATGFTLTGRRVGADLLEEYSRSTCV
jgi:RimJ/RimL family protein N-acetyltransferase